MSSPSNPEKVSDTFFEVGEGKKVGKKVSDTFFGRVCVEEERLFG